MNKEDYLSDVQNRYVHGELSEADSIINKGHKAFKTPSGKIVYDGGGISPDVFIPIDTNDFSTFYARVVSEGVLSEFVYMYADAHKSRMKAFPSLDGFIEKFNVDESLFREFLNLSYKKGINAKASELIKSKNSIKIQIKALFARQLFGSEGYYRIQQQMDKGLLKSIELLSAN